MREKSSIAFGCAISVAPRAGEAARIAAQKARVGLDGADPKLTLAFASMSYQDFQDVPSAIEGELGGAPLVGGSSGGCVIGPEGVAKRGVSVVVLGGEGLTARVASATVSSPDLLEIVPAAEQIARAADAAAREGFTEFACLAFAPNSIVDGEALVAALRKGAGVRAQLAGGLTGDDFTFDRAHVFDAGGAHVDRVVVAGIYTRVPLGIASRHGWSTAGPEHAITKADGAWLVALDGRPAIDVWVEDARAAGATPPPGRGKDLTLYLANHYELGLAGGKLIEPLVRAPFAIRADGAVRLSASVPEGMRARVMHATRADLFGAADEATRSASEAMGGDAAGALILSCAGRLAVLGEEFGAEPAAISKYLGAPVGGGCVFGEIALARKDVDAFHNTSVVVVAIPA